VSTDFGIFLLFKRTSSSWLKDKCR